MSDDRQLSNLISQSMRRELNDNESVQISDHMKQNQEARKFAELSQLIQNSVSGDINVNEGDSLSEKARQRLRDSVESAIKEKVSLSQDGLIKSTDVNNIGKTRRLSADKLVITDSESRELVSRFKLIRKLGEGGLGNVWLARDEKLNRSVAIKELKTSALDSAKALERFHREAEITGHLEHPNVVPLYVYGEDHNTGEPFYAMRFVGKRTLATAIEEYYDRVAAGQADALGLHRLLNVFLDVCQAIAYAHSRGIIHRDLKPENIALDSFGQVIVLDWGLAKVVEESELATKMTSATSIVDSGVQTVDGDVVGTPLYMSPEQAAGQLDKIDERTDVYGLGAILFSILTGKAPHEKSIDGHVPEVMELLGRISKADTPSAADYGLTMPADLEAICTKAMARKQHLRFETVTELANSVESWIAGQSGKKSAYEKLRMEGRELRAEMQARVQDLERNVRFCAGLPPIEQIIHVSGDEDIAIWRERLSSIFTGLLRANPDYRSIVYSRIVDKKFVEIVRVEKHADDAVGIRVVPKSRLTSGDANCFIDKIAEMKPGDVLTSLVCDTICNVGGGTGTDSVGLLSAVPVFDDLTEDVFGFVMINCDIDRILSRQASRPTSAYEVVVACDVFQIMLHTRNGKLVEGTRAKKISVETPYFETAVAHLQDNTEFVDERDADIFGARLWFIPNKHGIMYLLRRTEDKASV